MIRTGGEKSIEFYSETNNLLGVNRRRRVVALPIDEQAGHQSPAVELQPAGRKH